jgi:hypothetical protein
MRGLHLAPSRHKPNILFQHPALVGIMKTYVLRPVGSVVHQSVKLEVAPAEGCRHAEELSLVGT